MEEFYGSLRQNLAQELQRLSGEMKLLKSHGEELAQVYGKGARAEDILLALKEGKIDEHPGYERYLALRVIADEIENIRLQCRKKMEEA